MFKGLTDKQVIKILLTSLAGMNDQKVECIKKGNYHDSDHLGTLIKAVKIELDKMIL